MSYIDTYLNTLQSNELRESVVNTSNELVSNISSRFSFVSQLNCLLLGNVQSGKTGQMLGAISLLADKGYRLFILLTTDNVDLQRQTYNRVKKSLLDFNVISEKEEVLFEQVRLTRPTVIVLKKNSRVLRKWKDILVNTDICHGLPLVIFDDEADAASLNTKVNSNKVSPINRNLSLIKKTSTSSVYIEVTATPQAVLLQSLVSGWRPSFVIYFKPGSQYLGGNFFYSDPTSYCAKFTEDNELDKIIADDDTVIPDGLRDSILTFLEVCAYKKIKGETNCNFMIHPNVKIDVHNKFVNRVQEFLNLLEVSQNEKGFEKALKNIWADLQHTKPDFPSFEDIQNGVTDILENTEIMVVPLNSKSFVCRDSSNPDALDLSKGFNIVIGGNTLGRGITFPHLQTVYYCRSAKRMQADTFWQHSRIFGYDREKELVRIFIPQPLYKFFTELNKSNEMLIEQVTHGLENLQVILPADISPTRKTVLDSKYLNAIVGGMNFFASDPVDSNTEVIDSIVSQYGDALSVPTDKATVINLLQLVGSYDSQDFSSQKYISCVHALCAKRPSVKLRLIVRKNREISKGTGTLLSENDRKLGNKFADEIVLTLYRVNGEVAKGWNGKPLWIPNIKFPKNICFYDTFEN
uniref:Z1 domain-containing protein n=1 Tax=Segatella copri TaxID=165179 RepID=UPI0040299859